MIVAFSSAVLNSMIGLEADWFKLLWATLSAFGFAFMACLLGARFLVPAVLMVAITPLMVLWPAWHYLIYGLAWWAVLLGFGVGLRHAPTRAGLAMSTASSAGREGGIAFAVHPRPGGDLALVEHSTKGSEI